MGLNRRRNCVFGVRLRAVFEQGAHAIQACQVHQPLWRTFDSQLLAQAQASPTQFQQYGQGRGIEFFQGPRIQHQLLRARRHTRRQLLEAGPGLGMGENGG